MLCADTSTKKLSVFLKSGILRLSSKKVERVLCVCLKEFKEKNGNEFI